jgi:ketosteroid isomerase-like protein
VSEARDAPRRAREAVDMTDGELRALCHRFFDALESGDVGTLTDIYAEDLQFGYNATEKTSARDENLKAIKVGYAVHRRRRYNDRMIDTFDGGFIMRYTLDITHHSGRKTVLFPCLVVQRRDGKFVQMDEYIDSGKFSAPTTRSSGAVLKEA